MVAARYALLPFCFAPGRTELSDPCSRRNNRERCFAGLAVDGYWHTLVLQTMALLLRRNIRDDICERVADVIAFGCKIETIMRNQLCYRVALYPRFLRFPASSDYIFTPERVPRSCHFQHGAKET